MFHPVSNCTKSSGVMSMSSPSAMSESNGFDDDLNPYHTQYDDVLGEAAFSKWLDPNNFLVESTDFFQPSTPDLLMGLSSTSDVPDHHALNDHIPNDHILIAGIAPVPLAPLTLGLESVPEPSPSPANIFWASQTTVEAAGIDSGSSLGRRYIVSADYLLASLSPACPSLSLSPSSATTLTSSIPPTPLIVHPTLIDDTIDPSLLSPPDFRGELKVDYDALSDSSYDCDEDAEGEVVEAEAEVEGVVSDDDEDKVSQELALAVEEPAATPKQQTRRKDATRGTRKSATAGATRETRKAAAKRAQKATARKTAVVTRKNITAARKVSTPPRAQAQQTAAAPTTSRTAASSSSTTLLPVPGRQIPRSTRGVLAFADPSCVASSSSSAPASSSSRKVGQKRKRSSRDHDGDDDDDVPDRDAGDWRRYSGDDGSGSEHEDDGEMDVDNDSDYEQADDEDDEDYGRAHKRQKTAPAPHAQKKAPKAKRKGKAQATKDEQSEPAEQKMGWEPFCLSAGAHYSCKLCRKTFGRKGDVKRHLEQSCKHPDAAPLQNPVPCPQCKNVLSRYDALQRHLPSCKRKQHLLELHDSEDDE